MVTLAPPSQLNEIWALWPSVVRNFARHHETNEVLPDHFIEKIIAAEKFNKGYATSEYLAAALLDLAWHNLTADQVPSADGVVAFEHKALSDCGLADPLVPPRYRSTYLAHCFAGGYSAAYWAYVWSEILAANGEDWFKKNGGLTRKNGEHFLETVLCRGGTRDYDAMVKAFLGYEARVEPLLARKGLDV